MELKSSFLTFSRKRIFAGLLIGLFVGVSQSKCNSVASSITAQHELRTRVKLSLPNANRFRWQSKQFSYAADHAKAQHLSNTPLIAVESLPAIPAKCWFLAALSAFVGSCTYGRILVGHSPQNSSATSRKISQRMISLDALNAASPEGRPYDVIIRNATEDDIHDFVSVINEAFMADAFFKKENHYNRTDAVEAAELLLNPNATYLLAINQDNEVVGAIYVEWDSDTGKGNFGALSVKTTAERRGIGSRLVKAAEKWCSGRSGGRAFVMEAPVVSLRPDLFEFYRKLGYRAIRNKPWAYPEMLSGEYEVDFVVYEKQFPSRSGKPLPDENPQHGSEHS